MNEKAVLACHSNPTCFCPYVAGETLRQKVTIHGASVGSKSLGDLDAVVTDLAGRRELHDSFSIVKTRGLLERRLRVSKRRRGVKKK